MSALAAAPIGETEKEEERTLRLFDVTPETSRPTVITVHVTGEIKLDMAKKSDVDFYNSLQPGRNVSYATDFFVASTKTTHRRDGDGNVDAVPQSKSIKVDLVHYDGAAGDE